MDKVEAAAITAINKLKGVLLDVKLCKVEGAESRMEEIGAWLVAEFSIKPLRSQTDYGQVFICPICQEAVDSNDYILLGSDKYHDRCYRYMLAQQEEERRIWKDILGEKLYKKDCGSGGCRVE